MPPVGTGALRAEFRVPAVVPMIGLFGFPFVGYIFLYQLGIVRTELFSQVRNFELHDFRTFVYLFAVSFAAGILVAWWFFRIRIFENGFQYCTPISRRFFHWEAVLGVATKAGTVIVSLAGQPPLRLSHCFGRSKSLVDALVETRRDYFPKNDGGKEGGRKEEGKEGRGEGRGTF